MSGLLLLTMTLLPIAVILCLLIVFRKPADITGTAGWVAVSLVALFFFHTSVEVLLRSTIAGLIKSFPVSLIVATSLLQMAFLEKTGALKRIIIFIKTLSRDNRAVQIMMVNIGFGTLMVAVGATPVSLLPPILLAMGYSTYVAIALPAIGYDSLCTYALLGAPIVVFVDVARKVLGRDVSLHEAGMVFYAFLPVISTLIGFCMLWIAGKWQLIRQGWLPCLLTGLSIAAVAYFTNRYDNLVVLTGVLCGIAVILAMAIYLKITGRKVVDRTQLTGDEVQYERQYPLLLAFMPWLLLIALILALNLPQRVFTFLYRDFTMPIRGLTADHAVPGNRGIETRALWQAYTWILVSTLLSIPFLRPTTTQLKDTLRIWLKRAPRPVYAAAIFFAIGEVMNMSGFDMLSGKPAADSMVKVLADNSAQFFHGAYGAVVAWIGLFGGFITGSEASTIAMFGGYVLKTGQKLATSPRGLIILMAGLAFGGGLASVISPAKLQNAAASIDKIGQEGQVIRIAFVFSLALTRHRRRDGHRPVDPQRRVMGFALCPSGAASVNHRPNR